MNLPGPDQLIFLIPIMAIAVGLVGAIGGIAMGITKHMVVYYRKRQLDEIEGTLKLEMIQRGMSADEIERVLKARLGGSEGSRRHAPPTSHSPR